MKPLHLTTPLTGDVVETITAGRTCLVSGTVYTARDAAHKRLVSMLDQKQALPFELAGQIIYYVGPCPAPPGKVIGSAGPTTSTRMDVYTPQLLAAGVKGLIGKGDRGAQVVEALKKHRAVYFAAVGGAGALIARHIVRSQVVAFADLGPEAIHRLEVRDLPVVAVIDARGNNYYAQGRALFAKRQKIGYT